MRIEIKELTLFGIYSGEGRIITYPNCRLIILSRYNLTYSRGSSIAKAFQAVYQFPYILCYNVLCDLKIIKSQSGFEETKDMLLKNKYPICEFDTSKNPIIHPSNFLAKSLPEKCVITFSPFLKLCICQKQAAISL